MNHLIVFNYPSRALVVLAITTLFLHPPTSFAVEETTTVAVSSLRKGISQNDTGRESKHMDSTSSSSSSSSRSLSDILTNFWHLNTDPMSIQRKQHSFQKAFEESYGFFYDIEDIDWARMKDITIKRQFDQLSPSFDPELHHRTFFYANNWAPDFSCLFEKRLGKKGDGGKWVCDPHRIKHLSNIRKRSDGQDDRCLVYSIGSAGRASFEHALMEQLGEDLCEIHTFEMKNYEDVRNPKYLAKLTPKEIRLTKKINFHFEWGIRGSQEPPSDNLYTLAETIKSLGHEGRTIDIFKIDCEGCEWTTYHDWLSPSLPAELLQIIVEVHKYSDGSMEKTNEFFGTMRDAGYVMFHKEMNIISPRGCSEFSFLKLDPNFSRPDV